MMPQQGCRLILASDGLWDLMTYSKAVTLTRSKPTSAATSALIQVSALECVHVGCVW
jgi:serine/threonine protein phosphatase PrpC